MGIAGDELLWYYMAGLTLIGTTGLVITVQKKKNHSIWTILVDELVDFKWIA